MDQLSTKRALLFNNNSRKDPIYFRVHQDAGLLNKGPCLASLRKKGRKKKRISFIYKDRARKKGLL